MTERRRQVLTELRDALDAELAECEPSSGNTMFTSALVNLVDTACEGQFRFGLESQRKQEMLEFLVAHQLEGAAVVDPFRGGRCEHQYDEHGRHRLAFFPEGSPEPSYEGAWAGYQSPARLGPFLAVTEFWGWGEGSPYPAEVFRVSLASVPASKTVERLSPEWRAQHPEECCSQAG